MIIGTLNYPYGQYALPRPRCIGLCVVWWDGFSIVTAGNPSQYLETLFGGYQVYVKLYDWVWSWSTKTTLPSNIIEDMWAYAPGSGTPTSFGSADVFATWNNYGRGYFWTIAFAPFSEGQWYQQMPAHPSSYWNPPYPAPVSYPFYQT